MSDYWEFAAAGLILWVLFVLYVVLAWVRDKWRWRHVQPYYGRPYDASMKAYRPNVDLRRIR